MGCAAALVLLGFMRMVIAPLHWPVRLPYGWSGLGLFGGNGLFQSWLASMCVRPQGARRRMRAFSAACRAYVCQGDDAATHEGLGAKVMMQ